MFWLNRAETLERLRSAAKSLADRYPEIERVLLFGSLARGDAVPGSDADLLIILSESYLPFWDRSVKYRPERAEIGVDVFAYTRTELEDKIATGDLFVTRALREGVVLASRESERFPSVGGKVSQ